MAGDSRVAAPDENDVPKQNVDPELLKKYTAENDAHTANVVAESAAQADENARRAAAVKAYEGRFQYGGTAEGANDAAGRYRYGAETSQNRTGTIADFTQADADRSRGEQARGEQSNALGLMRDRATGKVPSIASQIGDRNIGKAVADQSSIAASARGPAGLALASQQQANQSANAISTINNQTEINGAQERERAEHAYLGAGTTIRAGDQAAGSLAVDKSKAQAALDDAQRSRNDTMQLGMTGRALHSDPEPTSADQISSPRSRRSDPHTGTGCRPRTRGHTKGGATLSD